MSVEENMAFQTRQIHSAHEKTGGPHPLATPIYQSSTFVFDSCEQGARRFSGEEAGYIYTRLGNPNADEVAAKVASLEGAEAGVCMASGMGAIASVIWTLLHAGDHLLADCNLYGCTYSLFAHGLTRYGVEVSFVDFRDLDAVARSMKPNTRAVYFETPTNPDLKIIDIAAVCAIAHRDDAGVKVVVDNTFATAYIQRPIELGADIVIHSATKYLNGHGDVIAGMAFGTKEMMTEVNLFGLKDMTGAVLGPFEAFLINRGLKTLDMRMERHSASAVTVARFLEGHPAVERVLYPGLESHPQHELAKRQMSLYGGMISFELKASRERTAEFINNLSLCTLAVSLGDAETLIEQPATMTHSTYTKEELAAVGVGESMIRLSVGLEAPEDIIADLKAGLDLVAADIASGNA